MLTDSSLTNIFLVSDVSQIRYRVYAQSCPQSSLTDFFKGNPVHTAHGVATAGPETIKLSLIRVYRNLIHANIPCLWRVSPDRPYTMTETESLDGSTISFELWVFWFDDRHTGKIDSNAKLAALEEINVGSFTWESAVAKSLSPTASPGKTTGKSSGQATSTVAEEYRLFVASISNVIREEMTRKGALMLGDLLIFPNDIAEYDAKNTPATHFTSNPLLPSIVDQSAASMLSCTYSIYLTNTNLLVQPSICRIYARPLEPSDLQIPGTQVIISPSGRNAVIGQNKTAMPLRLVEPLLRQWSQFLNIPYSYLAELRHSNADSKSPIPPLVFIMTAHDEPVLYPSVLVYARTSYNQATTSMPGMDGIMQYNQGYPDDLGEKWSRWAWLERANSLVKREKLDTKNAADEIASVNYWQYDSPKLKGISAIMDSISAMDIMSSQTVLQKALSEPISSSPIMAAKTVATPASSGVKMEAFHGETESHTEESNQSLSKLSLADFTLRNFADHEAEKQASLQHFHTASDQSPQTNDVAGAGDVQTESSHSMITPGVYSDQIMDPTPSSTSASRGLSSDIPTTTSSVYQSPQMSMAANDFEFGLSMTGIEASDSMLYGIQSRWDEPVSDLDNLNLDVTEEDFDFFESGKAEPQDSGFHSALATSTTLMDSPIMLFDAVGMDTMKHTPVVTKDEPLYLNQLLHNDTGLLETSLLLQEPSISEDQSVVKTNSSPIPDIVAFSTSSFMGTSADMQTLQGRVQASPSISPLLFMPQVANNSARKEHILYPSIIEIQTGDPHVPPEFAPVKFSAAVNDSKYYDDGKFIYRPKQSDQETGTGPQLGKKRDMYRPDFIPYTKKRALSDVTGYAVANSVDAKPIVETLLPAKVTNQPACSTEKSATDNSSLDASASTCDSDSDSDSDSESNSDSGDSYGDTYSQEEHEVNPGQWAAPLDHIPFAFASQFISIMGGQDTFAIHVEPVPEQSEEDRKILEYLCQQVVFGGYPFADGLSSLFGNGGELYEGVSANVLVSRRRSTIHSLHDNVKYASALPSEHDKMARELKATLNDIFNNNKTILSDGVEISIQASIPGSVSIKGPLSIQQYYELTETNQAHSKYGKYQVKKRRPAEPNLDILDPPNIVVSRQDDHLEGSTKLMTFWEKMRLEPYSPRKNISYFIVYPSNDNIESACTLFGKSLSAVYETCLLGAHHPGSIGPYRRGLVPVPLLPESPDESWDGRQLRSYMAECQNLGSALGGALAERMHIVIYLVNTSEGPASNLKMSQCFHKLMFAYQAASMGISTRTTEGYRARLVLQLLPMEHVLRSSAFGGYTKFGLKEIAFSVYSKCHMMVSRNHSQIGVEDTHVVSAIYAPPFVLAKPVPDSIQYSLSSSLLSFPTIFENNESLHLAYSTSLDRQWMAMIWTDNQGELLEFAVLHISGKSLATIFDEVWWRTKRVAQRTGFSWHYVIAKIGLMFEDELQAWLNSVPGDEKVAIVCVDLKSALRVQNSFDQSDITAMGHVQTPNPVANTPTPETCGSSNPAITSIAPSARSLDLMEVDGDAQALLLNHRIAYSNRREQLAEGILAICSDSWMLPLASGYLIQSQPKAETGTREQLDMYPVVIELHLVHNQMQHSAYSTLRDIIKRFHALSYMNIMPSANNCIPFHVVLVKRLSQVLSAIDL